MTALWIIFYLAAVNLAGWVAFLIDKIKARRGRFRVPEANLFVLALAFGTVGELIGMIGFRHKTDKLRFTIGLPVILALQVVGLILLGRSGVVFYIR